MVGFAHAQTERLILIYGATNNLLTCFGLWSYIDNIERI
jgi:hypothetical protein